MRLLVIWGNGWLGRSSAERAIAQLVEQWCGGIFLSYDEEENNLLPPGTGDFADIETLVDEYDVFLIPILPDEMIEHISKARCLTVVEAIARCALAIGKPVLILSSAFGPEDIHNSQGPIVESLKTRRDLAKACGFLIIADVDELVSWSSLQSRHGLSHAWHGVLAERNVLNAIKSGKRTIELASDAIVTPLAQDLARENGINLIKKHVDKEGDNEFGDYCRPSGGYA
jgi:hypothetical protein